MNNKFTKITAIVLALCVLLCGCAGNIDSELERAAKFLSEGNYEEAIIAFQAALKIDPKRAQTWADIIPAYEKAMANDYALDYTDEIIDAYEQLDELLEGLETPEDYIALADLYLLRGDKEKAEEIIDRGREKFGDEPFDNTLPKIIVTDEDADDDVRDALAQLYNLFAAGDTDGALSFINTGMVARELPKRNYTVNNGSGEMKCSFACNGQGSVVGEFLFLAGTDMQTITVRPGRWYYVAHSVYSGGAYNGPFSARGTYKVDGSVWTKTGTFVNNLCDGTITVVTTEGRVLSGQMSMGHTLEPQKEGVNGCIYGYDSYGDWYCYIVDEDANYLFDITSMGVPEYPTW